MDYKIMNKPAFTVLAHAKTFSYEGAKTAVPQFWQEHFAAGLGAAVMGTYGINIDAQMGSETFEYLIADPVHGAGGAGRMRGADDSGVYMGGIPVRGRAAECAAGREPADFLRVAAGAAGDMNSRPGTAWSGTTIPRSTQTARRTKIMCAKSGFR